MEMYEIKEITVVSHKSYADAEIYIYIYDLSSIYTIWTIESTS